MKTITTAILAIGLLAGTGQADTPDATTNWQLTQDRIIAADGRDAGRSADFYTFSRTIKAATPGSVTTSFVCNYNTRDRQALGVAFQLDPANIYDQGPRKRLRTLSMIGHITIGEQKTLLERMIYHPNSTRATPRDPAIARKMFNAVVRGDTVTLKAMGDTYTVALPAIDEAFTSFAKSCPVTNGGTADMSVFDNAEAITSTTSGN